MGTSQGPAAYYGGDGDGDGDDDNGDAKSTKDNNNKKKKKKKEASSLLFGKQAYANKGQTYGVQRVLPTPDQVHVLLPQLHVCISFRAHLTSTWAVVKSWHCLREIATEKTVFTISSYPESKNSGAPFILLPLF